MLVVGKLHQLYLKIHRGLRRPPLKIRDGPVLVRWFNLVDGSKGGGIDAGGPQKVILFDNLSLTLLGSRVIQADFALAFRSRDTIVVMEADGEEVLQGPRSFARTVLIEGVMQHENGDARRHWFWMVRAPP